MNQWKKIRIVLCSCLYLGWWGFVYPEVLITPDTCRIVCEDGTGEETLTTMEELSAEELYQALLKADPQQIHYRSRLLELLETLLEKR